MSSGHGSLHVLMCLQRLPHVIEVQEVVEVQRLPHVIEVQEVVEVHQGRLQSDV